jgi:hypothetical protein
MSVGQIPSLEGENHRFWFWLVKSELEPGLTFGTRSRTRTGVSDFTKKQNQTGTRILVYQEPELELDLRFLAGKKCKKGLEQEQDPRLLKKYK